MTFIIHVSHLYMIPFYVTFQGALSGLFSGLTMTFWVGIGAQIYKHPNPKLNMSIAGCETMNSTFLLMDNITTVLPNAEPEHWADGTTEVRLCNSDFVQIYCNIAAWVLC